MNNLDINKSNWFYFLFSFQYSDADIVLSKDWVPPITIAPTQVISHETDSPARKKTNSVSFSLDSSSEADPNLQQLPSSDKDVTVETDKGAESRKNKVIFLVFLCN